MLMFALTAFVLLVTFGCGAQMVPTTMTEVPVPIEGLDGETGVDVSSSFSYVFDQAVDASTVTTETFFILDANQASASVSKAGTDICDSSLAHPATVSYSSGTEFTLDPTEDLSADATYVLCLTNGIVYLSGDPFIGFMAWFATGSILDRDAGCGDQSCASAFSGPCNNGTADSFDDVTYDLGTLSYIAGIAIANGAFVTDSSSSELVSCIAEVAYAAGDHDDGCIGLPLIVSSTTQNTCLFTINQGSTSGEEPVPVPIEDLPGCSDSMPHSHGVNFSPPVKTETVTTSTFFITPVSESLAEGDYQSFDAAICNVATALEADVTCSSSTECELQSIENVSVGSKYAICFSTDIIYEDETPYQGYMWVITISCE